MARKTRQKINQETEDLNNSINQLDLPGIYRTFHLTTGEYTFFSSSHGLFSGLHSMLGHKTSLNKFSKDWNHKEYIL